MASGWQAATHARTAPRSVTSSVAWSTAVTSWSAKASTSSWPSCPPAPVTRPRRTATSGAVLQGLPPPGVVAVPGDRVLERLAELALRRPPERRHLVDRDRVAAVVPEAVLDGLDHRLRLPESLEERVRELEVGD